MTGGMRDLPKPYSIAAGHKHNLESAALEVLKHLQTPRGLPEELLETKLRAISADWLSWLGGYAWLLHHSPA